MHKIDKKLKLPCFIKSSNDGNIPDKSMLVKPGQIPLMFLLVIVVLAAPAAVVIAGCSADPEIHYFNAKVPVNYKDLKNIGSLHIEVEFDDRLLTPLSAEKAAGAGGVFSYGKESSARLVIGVAGLSLNGSGTIAYVTFKVNDDAELPADIVLSNVIATDTANKKVDVIWSPGSINPSDHKVSPPQIVPLP